MKRIISTLFVSLLLIGCADDKNNTNPGAIPSLDDDPSEKVFDISTLSLEERLKAKYSKLQYNCSYTTTVTRPTNPGGFSTTQTSRNFYLWDILADFSETKTVEIEHDFANITSKFSWDFSLSLIGSLRNQTVDEEGIIIYELKNAAYVKGSSEGKIVQYDENGRVMTSQASSSTEETAYDRIPYMAKNLIFGPSEDDTYKTGIRIDCLLDAEVKAGYEGDFKVSKP